MQRSAYIQGSFSKQWKKWKALEVESFWRQMLLRIKAWVCNKFQKKFLIEVQLFAALRMRERPLWVATDSIPEFEQCFYIICINRFWIAEHAWNVCCCKCYIFHRLTFPRDWVQPKEEAEGPRASLQFKGKSLFSSILHLSSKEIFCFFVKSQKYHCFGVVVLSFVPRFLKLFSFCGFLSQDFQLPFILRFPTRFFLQTSTPSRALKIER